MTIFRAICRALAAVLFTAAVLAGLLDASRTVARGGVVMTPFVEDLSVAAPTLLVSIREGVGETPVLAPLVEWLLGRPSWLLFAALALVFGLIGQRPQPRYRRYIRE